MEDVATDQQTGGLAPLMIDRVTASRLGIAPRPVDNTLYDAYGQRQISTMYTQLNQYHVVLESLARIPAEPGRTDQAVHPGQRSSRRQRSRGQHFFFLVGFVLGRLQRAHHLSPYTPTRRLRRPATALTSSASAPECHHHHGHHGRRHPCRSAPSPSCSARLGRSPSTTRDSSPRSPSLQPGARHLAGRRHHGH